MEPQRQLGAPGAQVIVISGPSGVGKDTIINELRRRPVGQAFHYVVTCTTRAPRVGEMDGVHYHFHSRETFDALNAAGELLEAAIEEVGVPDDLAIEADGTVIRARPLMVAFANSSQYGNGARIAPRARLDDGRLDVVVVGR